MFIYYLTQDSYCLVREVKSLIEIFISTLAAAKLHSMFEISTNLEGMLLVQNATTGKRATWEMSQHCTVERK